MEKIKDIKISEGPDGKTLELGFFSTKNSIVILVYLFLGILTVGFLVTPMINYNGSQVDMSLLSRIELLLPIWITPLAIYYLFYYSLSIIFNKKNDGSIIIEKHGSFFTKKKFSFNTDQNLTIIGKKGRMFARGLSLRLFAKPTYELSINYDLNGARKETLLYFEIAYYSTGIGYDIGFLNKEQLEYISSQLKIPLIIKDN